MVLPSTIHQREWRLKIKQDPAKYEKYKEKDRSRKKVNLPTQFEEESSTESNNHDDESNGSNDVKSGDESNQSNAESADGSSETNSEDSESDEESESVDDNKSGREVFKDYPPEVCKALIEDPKILRVIQAHSTPRDVTSRAGYSRAFAPQRAVSPNFRYRGYPIGRFEQPRDQLPPTINHADFTRSDEARYAKAQYFDTRNPKIFDEPNKGLLYGSIDLPDNVQEPKPLNNPINDKTAAELRKHKKLQLAVALDIAKYKAEKRQALFGSEQQKRSDFRMLQQYNPWGRPGGGAPNNTELESHKKQKFTETEVTSRVPQKARANGSLSTEKDDFLRSFGKPGGGAPRRTNSGHVTAEVKADVNIRFQDRQEAHQTCDRDFRYKKSDEERIQYSKDLDNQIEQKNTETKEEKLSNLRQELEMLRQREQDKQTLRSPSRQCNREDIYYLFDPWGRGVGQPIRDDRGEIKRHKFSNKAGVSTDKEASYQPPPEKGVTLQLGGHGGGGAPLKTASGHVISRLPISMMKNKHGEVIIQEGMAAHPQDQSSSVYDPWGRDGAGAPLRGEDGHIVANVYGKMQHEQKTPYGARKSLEAKQYLSDLQQGIQQQQINRQENEVYRIQECGDMAALIHKSRSQQPKRDHITGHLVDQHRNTSDVTKLKADIRPQKTELSSLYHTQLEHAAEQRNRELKLDQLRGLQQDKEHQSTMSSFWGKPGGGAPKPTSNKFGNINESIYSPRKQLHASYKKQYEDNVSAPVGYVRTTINSDHSNQYEYMPASERNQYEKSKSLPWATMGQQEIA